MLAHSDSRNAARSLIGSVGVSARMPLNTVLRRRLGAAAIGYIFK